jgi:glycosyltransferase involved in cell wall biosynthesis
MRVLHLTTEFPPVIYGGLGTAVGGWVKASARAGIEVAVQLVEGPLVLGESGGAYGSPQPPLARGQAVAGEEGILFYTSSWEAAVDVGLRAISGWRPDVVHLHTAMLWYLAEAIQRRTGKPIVYHVHSVDRAEYELGQEPSPWLAHSVAQEQAIRSADRLIALARDEADLIARYYPEARNRVRVVGNGIEDTQEARAAAFDRAHEGAPLILYSGRLVERKGIRELLGALPEVLEAAPECRAVVAGGPPLVSGTQVAEQWLGPEHSRLRERIHFTGWLSPSNVSRWYQAADILVVPSRYEPFGMVVLEGMLYGLPIVAAEVGGPAEIVEHGRTGLLFPPRNTKALARELRRLVEDPQKRRSMGRAAARAVRSRWLWSRLVPLMQGVYGELFPHTHEAVLNRSAVLPGAA